MKYLSIDYGLSHIGMAIGDDFSKIAMPYDTISERNLGNLVEKIIKIIEIEQIEALVVGVPISLRGNESEQSASTLSFINKLTQVVNIPVYQEDERLTSQIGKKQINDGALFDEHALAAAAILQLFLDKLP